MLAQRIGLAERTVANVASEGLDLEVDTLKVLPPIVLGREDLATSPTDQGRVRVPLDRVQNHFRSHTRYVRRVLTFSGLEVKDRDGGGLKS